MKITKQKLRRIIREAIDKSTMPAREFQTHPPWGPIQGRWRPKGGITVEFDNEYVTFPEGGFKGQDELAAEVAPRAEWDDDFDKMGMYAAMALAKNYGVTTVTDAEQPGKSWSIGEFITHLQKIASEAW